MLASKIIYNIYSLIKVGIKHTYNFLINIPAIYKLTLCRIKAYIEDTKFRVKNLGKVNFELGLYHLERLNINDAIIRFKLVYKFFNKGDRQANYWLGWCYFLKNNFESALYHLNNAGEADSCQLKDFIQNYRNYSEIPEKILQQYRDLAVGGNNYTDKYWSESQYLPTIFIQKTLDRITNLPDDYNILEINCEIGFLGAEIKKRFPDNLKLTGIEISEKMINVVNLNNQYYNELVNISLQKFALKGNAMKFDVILSACGLVFTKDFRSYLPHIVSLLNDNGYFAFSLPGVYKNSNPAKLKQYGYEVEEIKKIMENNKFNLLGFDELKLGINNKYYIYIFKKNQTNDNNIIAHT